MKTLASLCLGLAACASTPNQPPSLPHSQLGGADYEHVSRAVGIVLDRQLAPDNGAPRTLADDADSDLTGSTRTMIPISGRGTLGVTYDRTRSDTGEVARWDFDVDAAIAGTVATFTIDGIGYQIDLSTGIISRV